MKITPNLVPPVPVKSTLESVTLTLTPREAFMLLLICGNQNYESLAKTVNYGNYAQNPPFDVDIKLKGLFSIDELGKLSSGFYNGIKKIISEN